MTREIKKRSVGQRRGKNRSWMLPFMVFFIVSCSGEKSAEQAPKVRVPSPPPEAQKSSQQQPKEELSIVRPERDASRSLQAAKNLVLGMHVPTGFVMRNKRPGAVLGMVYTYEKNLTSFYRDLGYHVVKYERGYKITATSRMLDALPPQKRELLQSAAIYTTPKRARWWSLQILSSHRPEQNEPEPDPMAFVNEEAKAPRESKEKTDSNKAVPPRIPYVKRSFKRPKNTVDLRPKLRKWIQTNPNRKFLD